MVRTLKKKFLIFGRWNRRKSSRHGKNTKTVRSGPSEMLRYLTHKLRNQSLTESETYNGKTDDDHDSGTESDDEGADIEELQKYMETIICLDGNKADRKKVSRDEVTTTRSSSTKENIVNSDQANTMCAHSRQRHSQNSRASKGEDPDSPVPEPALDSALPSDSDHNFDHHSSEEELEVINGELCRQPLTRHVRSVQQQQQQQQHPEKRKWSQANRSSNHHVGKSDGGDDRRSSAVGEDESSEEDDDDDEVRDLMWCDVSMAPVEFRTSPPANVHKPRKCLSPPPKVFHLASVGVDLPPHELCSVSPRKRHRRTPTATAVVLADRNIQRPCLDFEKMQQINRVRLL